MEMTQAQAFVTTRTTTARIAAQLAVAGAQLLGCFEDNAFYAMPDGSRVIVTTPLRGSQLVRSAPATAA
jgi:hypothetical protein